MIAGAALAVPRLRRLSWLDIARFGLVQASLGAVVVLTTSTINRVMVVELALPALLPGLLVALHYGVQLLRPRWGYGSDKGRRRTPWIVGGMALLAAGGTGAALATAWMEVNLVGGVALAAASFLTIGIGVGASGTSLLTLLAKMVEPERRAPAATVVWMMMIAGIVATAITAGQLLEPFSTTRLVLVTAGVSVLALLVTIGAMWGVEGAGHGLGAAEDHPPFRQALAEVWAEPQARRLAVFIFVSMLAYSTEDLVLDPFAGSVFGYTPGQSTKLSGLVHAGVLAGMLIVAVLGRRVGTLRGWMAGGCAASAVMLALLAVAGLANQPDLVKPAAFALGVANGTFSIAAIGTMMGMASSGAGAREGVRMGLWGAAQGIAFGAGGLLGAIANDIARALIADTGAAYGAVFLAEAVLFLVAVVLATRITSQQPASTSASTNRAPPRLATIGS